IDQPVREQPSFPLEMVSCQECTLVQIGFEADKRVLFPPDYPYLSGTTKILRENFADLYRESSALVKLSPTSLVVDIGSNDGTLLSNFKDHGHKVTGVEPSLAAELANSRGIKTNMRFFDDEAVAQIISESGKADLVTAANVFAHIADVHSVVRSIRSLLTEDGVFVSESHYLLPLLQTLQYDTIYHEHLRYYSLHSLQYLFEKNGLEIFHVKMIPTHGGSVRVYTAPKGLRPVQASVGEALAKEKEAGLLTGGVFKEFREAVLRSKLELMSLLEKVKKEKRRVVGIGAPSRASTLINYVGLDEQIMDCVLEVSSSKKLNKFIPGTKIPVLDEAKLYSEQPDYA
ncbi:MAG: methyltransferase domain-containing protein, partial [Proteobacteria bacterium]